LHESGNVYAQGYGRELLETDRAVADEAGGAAPVAVSLVVEADADLEDALI
jgi:hypothetical protein